MPVDIRQEVHANARAPDRRERVYRKARAEVGAADTDADDVGDARRDDRIDHSAHGNSCFACHRIRSTGSFGIDKITAQRGMQRRTTLGDVDLLAVEQRANAALEIQRFAEAEQGIERYTVVALAGEAGVDRTDPQREIACPIGIVGDEVAERCLAYARRLGAQRAEAVGDGHALRGLCGDRLVGVGQAVVAVDVDAHRLELGGFRLIALSVRGDDDEVAGLRQMRGCAIDGNRAAALFRTDRIGHEARALVHVPDVDLLVLADARDVEQAPVDRARAFVVQLGVGDGGTMDLGLEHVQEHGGELVPQAAGTGKHEV
ncbi:hypothetical protein ACVWWW_001571 [Lysobacter sp. HA18]